jgi:hypothetical protein
VIARFHGH